MSLKDRDPSAATDHILKEETGSPSLLHLSMNLFEGLASVCSNRSSSDSRKSFCLHFWSVHQIAERMHIDQRQQFIISKQKQGFLRFSTCPSISLKDADPSPATVRHLNVETVFHLALDLSLHFLGGLASVSSNIYNIYFLWFLPRISTGRISNMSYQLTAIVRLGYRSEFRNSWIVEILTSFWWPV